MSKIKSPKEKKALSLKRDRRNTFGESPTAVERTSLVANSDRTEKHAARQTRLLPRFPSEEHASQADTILKAELRIKQLRGFKKQPDTPLGEVIKQKHATRKESGMYTQRKSARTADAKS